ncbi:MAG: UTP--glucose-1-phosphate uridylyltransferase [Actinomycetaceae bacterium]|nr:UTP--glucose-1-phosphate uridylyltransferase [Arcanobacterium sp.]MDD7504998.1 UTP--glucose-1-phosphate uridylyltransferase [Actinomycetaceae bacterium]MDY6143345.1 UTP--glucose-1-phosphate uridylyltransferase [Arcanobacterium sp.]
MVSFDAAEEKMRAAGASELAIKVFTRYARQVSEGATGLIPEETIEPITQVPSIEDISVDPEKAHEALDATVLLKLNGGLGTSMGMDKAKSLLPVRDGLRFIDIIAGQIKAARERYDVRLPLILMNSFRTREDSLEALDPDIEVDGLPIDFLQGKEPKLLVDTLQPAQWPADPSLEWCPPGHGDIYTTLADTGLVDRMLDLGYKYMMTSNADNLGATPSAEIAAWFAASGADYAPEVCVRTAADRKGGHLARRISDGRVILRDTAQTPPDQMDYFTDEHRHPFFHTNNLWFNLEALRDLLRKTDGVVDLPLIRNRKHVDPTDSSSPEVYQLETAMGAIVQSFAHAQPVCVPRSRFLPVKTTNDLFLLRSDVYKLTPDYHLALIDSLQTAPTIDLDKNYYGFVADFDERIPAVPSIQQLESLKVTGDVAFTGHEELSGTLEISGRGRIGVRG